MPVAHPHPEIPKVPPPGFYMRPLLILLVKFQAVFKHDITWASYVAIINILFDLVSDVLPLGSVFIIYFRF